MATTGQSLVVGLFQDRDQTEQAVDALEQAGFSDDQISYSGHRGGAAASGLLAGLKSLFTDVDTETGNSNVTDALVKMGMTPENAQYYQQQYDAGRSIVAVAAGSNIEEARSILSRYGAYSANKSTTGTTEAADYNSTATTDTMQEPPVDTTND